MRFVSYGRNIPLKANAVKLLPQLKWFSFFLINYIYLAVTAVGATNENLLDADSRLMATQRLFLGNAGH